jgi:hypothetical protein
MARLVVLLALVLCGCSAIVGPVTFAMDAGTDSGPRDSGPPDARPTDAALDAQRD